MDASGTIDACVVLPAPLVSDFVATEKGAEAAVNDGQEVTGFAAVVHAYCSHNATS